MNTPRVVHTPILTKMTKKGAEGGFIAGEFFVFHVSSSFFFLYQVNVALLQTIAA